MEPIAPEPLDPPRSRPPRHSDRRAAASRDRREPIVLDATLPILLNVDEAASLLRTSRRAIYAMIARRQLPGVVRIRRRVLVRSADLLDWLYQKRAPSPEE
jgi:excisionase family DNA binding protein